MYLPIFIAILLGLVSPSNKSANKRCGVYINVNQPKPEYSTFNTDSIPPGNEDGTGGDTGHVPPPRPKP